MVIVSLYRWTFIFIVSIADEQSVSPIATISDAISIVQDGDQMEGVDNPYVPDFTLFCNEKVTYLKITRNLYLMALRTTEIEKQRENSDKLQSNRNSHITSGDESDSDLKISSAVKSVLFKERKAHLNQFDQLKFRKLSMGTNLPESSLNQEFSLASFRDCDRDGQRVLSPLHRKSNFHADHPVILQDDMYRRKNIPNDDNIEAKSKSADGSSDAGDKDENTNLLD